MSGSRAKALRRIALRRGLTTAGYRALKRYWTRHQRVPEE